jgi:hypothetical protein
MNDEVRERERVFFLVPAVTLLRRIKVLYPASHRKRVQFRPFDARLMELRRQGDHGKRVFFVSDNGMTTCPRGILERRMAGGMEGFGG